MRDPTFETLLGKRGLFIVIFLTVTVLLVGTSYWVITFVYRQTQPPAPVAQLNDPMDLIYVNYRVNPDEYVSAESYLAMGDYLRQNEQPQNLQVLTGISTAEIISYMRYHFSAGLAVDCTHCHTLSNFAADIWDDPVAMANKVLAREHLRMTQDLNREWLPQLASLTPLKQPSGVQITCATCHNGVAKPVPWPANQASVPPNLRLPKEPVSVDGIDILNVNGRRDISLDTVDYQQNIMYHMNVSLNVGCTHCHNSRYFPSWEVPAKYYALHMVQMSQFITEKYGLALRGSEASCLMCHHEQVIPPGAVRSPSALPAQLVASPPQQ